MKPVLLFESDVQAVHAALVKAGETQLAEMVAEKAKRSEHDLKFIEGIPCLGDCDYDVDDCPVVSASEDGAYVLVWRWVTNEEAGIVSPVAEDFPGPKQRKQPNPSIGIASLLPTAETFSRNCPRATRQD